MSEKVIKSYKAFDKKKESRNCRTHLKLEE